MKLSNLVVPVLIGAVASASYAQPNRLRSRIDNSTTHILPGRVHPLANAANDQGEVASNFPLPYITMMLHPSAAQQSALQQLLQDQQNPKSTSYHQWLTPEQYADRFGVSTSDMAQIVSWLQSQGFTVNPLSRSRTFITFSGNAGQVNAAFGTTIHHYKVNGVMHYANSTDPTIPSALSPMVSGFRGLHDFRPKARIAKASPKWTHPPDGLSTYALAPDDFATIYDITPMYSAGINGSGVKIAIMGQTQISASDITSFWNMFGIKSTTLVQKLVTGSPNPGVSQGDNDESALDIEWSGAVARGATIEFVYSDNVWDSATYAVDQNVAPVLSISYGNCEMFDLVDLPSNQQLVQQANAEGMTWFAAAGDSGATDCDYGVNVAEGGLAVDSPGSIPEVTSMGGTSLSGGASYWSTGNSSTYSSAKGYIPEVAWNDTAVAIEDGYGILGTGGGASVFFPQPTWQTSGGVPNDGWRHVPDLAFNASVYTVPYYVYCLACQDTDNGIEYVGGTSAATPTMAGVAAMVNQYLNTNGLGNINPTIYKLFVAAPSAFHNNITGNNIEPCAYASPGCSNGQEGFTANGSGYSSVVGFGSVDVTKLIQSWSSGQPSGSVVTASLDQNPVYQGFSESCGTASTWNFKLTVSEDAGFATTLSGLTVNGTDYSSQINSIFGTSSIGARQSISGCISLSGLNAPVSVPIAVSGPNWSTSLNMSFQGPQAQLDVGGATNAASYAQKYAPGMILAVFGTGMGSLSQAASTIPLPSYMAGVEAYVCPRVCASDLSNGYPAYLYYVGPNQINVQIPYEVSGAVDLNVGNPYANFDFYLTVSAIAPGIFTFLDGTSDINPSRTASPGSTTFLFITGEGQVSPALPDGTSPAAGTPLAQLPKPREAVTVTIGSGASAVNCPTTFVGIPPGLVGVTQINFTIPSNVPTGRQPVIVTVGTVATPTAYITIQ